ncbi:MAG: hypothetical protein BGO11_09425 [Solirubrobacterales bacterium 70-9]|nr:MAG: hypothetical protein BGO11_09425 [Solirubrobacterales bacterium 70-9]
MRPRRSHPAEGAKRGLGGEEGAARLATAGSRLALAAVVAIGGAAALVAIGVNAWWWLPMVMAVALWPCIRQ